MRYEFIEILVRISNEKYVETEMVDDIQMGLEKLLNEHIKP